MCSHAQESCHDVRPQHLARPHHQAVQDKHQLHNSHQQLQAAVAGVSPHLHPEGCLLRGQHTKQSASQSVHRSSRTQQPPRPMRLERTGPHKFPAAAATAAAVVSTAAAAGGQSSSHTTQAQCLHLVQVLKSAMLHIVRSSLQVKSSPCQMQAKKRPCRSKPHRVWCVQAQCLHSADAGLADGVCCSCIQQCDSAERHVALNIKLHLA